MQLFIRFSTFDSCNTRLFCRALFQWTLWLMDSTTIFMVQLISRNNLLSFVMRDLYSGLSVWMLLFFMHSLFFILTLFVFLHLRLLHCNEWSYVCIFHVPCPCSLSSFLLCLSFSPFSFFRFDDWIRRNTPFHIPWAALCHSCVDGWSCCNCLRDWFRGGIACEPGFECPAISWKSWFHEKFFCITKYPSDPCPSGFKLLWISLGFPRWS